MRYFFYFCALLNFVWIQGSVSQKVRTSKQILTASSAMVKTKTLDVIPGAFYYPEAKPREK